MAFLKFYTDSEYTDDKTLFLFKTKSSIIKTHVFYLKDTLHLAEAYIISIWKELVTWHLKRFMLMCQRI